MPAGWKLLQSRLAQPPAPAPKTIYVPTAPQSNVPQSRGEGAPTHRPRRTIRIRSSWAVNTNGVWQEGNSDHTIEIDD